MIFQWLRFECASDTSYLRLSKNFYWHRQLIYWNVIFLEFAIIHVPFLLLTIYLLNENVKVLHTLNNLQTCFDVANSFPYVISNVRAFSLISASANFSLLATWTAHWKIFCEFCTFVSNMPPENIRTEWRLLFPQFAKISWDFPRKILENFEQFLRIDGNIRPIFFHIGTDKNSEWTDQDVRCHS